MNLAIHLFIYSFIPRSFHILYSLIFSPLLEIQLKPQTLFERLVRPPANEQEDQAATRDLWKMFECHEQILNEHEKRLENNITKIEIIREILEQQKGTFQAVKAGVNGEKDQITTSKTVPISYNRSQYTCI